MNIKSTFAAGLVLCSSMALPVAATAQVRHRHLKTWGTGIAAYEVAKHTGRRGHKNVFQRHPVLTGVGAGLLMRHHLKHHHHY